MPASSQLDCQRSWRLFRILPSEGFIRSESATLPEREKRLLPFLSVSDSGENRFNCRSALFEYGILHHRLHSFWRRNREIHPRATAPVAFGIGQGKRLGSVDPDQRAVDLLHITAVKALSHKVLSPDVEGLQRPDLIPIAQRSGPHCLTPDLEKHLFPYFPLLRFSSWRLQIPDLGRLGMKAGRKKGEGVMAEREPFSPLMNTSFAQQKLLPPLQQSVTYGHPFLVSDALVHPVIQGRIGMMSK